MSVTIMLGGKSEDLAPAIDTAIALAKRMKTRLTGLCAMRNPANAAIYVAGTETVVMGAQAIESIKAAQDELAAELEAQFTEQAKAAGPWLSATFQRETGSEALYGAAYASLADAFVLPKESTQSNHPLNPVFEHVLMEANLPIVLAPRTPTDTDTCVIAWDGSPQTARAVKLHLPLIAHYSKVVLVENPDRFRHQWANASRGSVERLTEMLHEERLDVVHETGTGHVSDSILKAAAAHDASLIVMGAYGHMRIGQMLFGGTTSKILHKDEAPALALCH